MTIYSLGVLLPNLEPVCCSMFSSNSCFLTYIQILHEADKVVWYSHLAGVQPRQDPGGTLRMYGVGERERRHVRLALIGRSLCFTFWQPVLYPFTNVFKVQDAYSWLHRISITSFCFLGKAGCFLLSNSVVILSTWSSGLGAINILYRSGECKPVFRFYGDLNWMVAVS